MRNGSNKSARRGFSLMEVVISIGIVAIIIPIVLALTVAGGNSSRQATEDTRAVMLATTVMEEVRRARDGRGEFVEGDLPWPDFPDGQGRIALSATSEGELLGLLEDGQYEQGVPGNDVSYIVSVRGEIYAPASDPEAEILSKVELRVESPARASSENRRVQVFVRLMHPDD